MSFKRVAEQKLPNLFIAALTDMQKCKAAVAHYGDATT